MSQKTTDDLYVLLHVIPRADPCVIEAAYEARLKTIGLDTVAFERLKAAKDKLLDPKERAAYDADRNDLESKNIGPYRLVRKIGEGAFGKTYEAAHVRLGSSVCIKHCSKISPEVDKLLEEEARTIWDLRHYALPAVRDVLRLDDGSSALVMSFIKGPTLAKVVELHGALDPEHAAWIMSRLLGALQYLHYQGVVHGDVKPQNVILEPEKHEAVLVDFGLAMVKPAADEENRGFTQLFSPPEQRKKFPLLPESDFYALGMSLVFALNGGSFERTKRREIPKSVPNAFAAFLAEFVRRDVNTRPKWLKDGGPEDLLDRLAKVRQTAFGRLHSNMKPLEQ